MTDLETRIEETKDFIASGRVVCHFAKRFADRIAVKGVSQKYTPKDIRNPFLNLAEDTETMAAVYVFATNYEDHVYEKARAIDFFVDLVRISTIAEHGKKRAKPILKDLIPHVGSCFNPASPLHYCLTHKKKGYFVAAMGPLYDENHPRWAPHPIIVITKAEDIHNTPDREKNVIRKKILQRVGYLYDPVELYVIPK